MTNLDILYEDDDVLVLNKPAGLSVHRSLKEPEGTLAELLVEHDPTFVGVGEDPDRPGIVHRLDKDTSGVLVVARNQEMFQTLKKLFQQRQVQKRYLAIVDGRIKAPRGTIRFPIGRYGIKRIAVQGKEKVLGARDAETEYVVRRRFHGSTGSPQDDATLVELFPKTGRMHQLRVHLKALGHPILGDRLYGGKRVAARAPRQMLHALSLSFSVGDRRYLFETDPPEDFSAVLHALDAAVEDE